MLDLDVQEIKENNQGIQVSLLAWLLTKKMKPSELKNFQIFLGLDTYILPLDRILTPDVLLVLTLGVSGASELFESWLIADKIESYFTEIEQILACAIVNATKTD